MCSDVLAVNLVSGFQSTLVIGGYGKLLGVVRGFVIDLGGYHTGILLISCMFVHYTSSIL